MVKHFIKKHSISNKVEINNNDKKIEVMNNENLSRMEEMANALTPAQTTKRIKKDKGLIERVESEKTLLTEDNKELLLG